MPPTSCVLRKPFLVNQRRVCSLILSLTASIHMIEGALRKDYFVQIRARKVEGQDLLLSCALPEPARARMREVPSEAGE